MYEVNKNSSFPQPKRNQKTNQNRKTTQTTTQKVKKPKTPQPRKTKNRLYQSKPQKQRRNYKIPSINISYFFAIEYLFNF